MEKESKSVGLEKEDAMNQTRWRVGVEESAVRVGYIRMVTVHVLLTLLVAVTVMLNPML